MYKMTISLNVLNHLGIGLYSNVAAVLSEIVANAWDADAEKVEINFDKERNTITVKDDGLGMTEEDINNKFLLVGYQKRLEPNGSVTPKGRQPMGRKGIGKLSVFSIADEVEVFTAKNHEKNALAMNIEEIKTKIQASSGQEDYQPKPLDPNLVDFSRGTKIVMKMSGKRRFDVTAEALRVRLARRFRVLGPQFGFKVFLDDNEITEKDSGIFENLEYIWYFGDESSSVIDLCPNATAHVQLSPWVSREHEWKITGYIGTVREQKDLGGENPYIALFARRKLIQEDILADFKEGRIFSKYVIGEIDAEFLDVDDLDDIVTSDRQRVKDDARLVQLRTFLKSAITTVGTQWQKFRGDKGVERALMIPAIKEWYQGLGKDTKDAARKMFGRIESLGLPTSGRSELYKQSIVAFQRFAVTDLLKKLDEIENADQFEAITRIFGEIDELESAQYFQIVQGRLKILSKFEDIVDAHRKEKLIQAHLFTHLWLLDPSWERASTNARVEQSVTKEFKKVDAGLTREQKAGRIDIRYKTAAGKHIIIELKKYEREISIFELLDQLDKYKSALERCLQKAYPHEQHIVEIIAVLGSRPKHHGNDPHEVEKLLAAINARFITYDNLIVQTQESYGSFLEVNKKAGELSQLLQRVDAELADNVSSSDVPKSAAT